VNGKGVRAIQSEQGSESDVTTADTLKYFTSTAAEVATSVIERHGRAVSNQISGGTTQQIKNSDAT